MKINERHKKIVEILTKNTFLSPDELHFVLGKSLNSRSTLNRDLKKLLEDNTIKKVGVGKTTKYALNQSKILKNFDVFEYYKTNNRTNIIEKFNMDIFSELTNPFTKEEMMHIDSLNKLYKDKIQRNSFETINEAIENFIIDFSYKSSSIEGNHYSLFETERLIKENITSPWHSDTDAKMILNHKDAINYVLDNKNYFKEISLLKIEELHHLISDGLSISFGIRKRKVRIGGTNYLPLDNEFSIKVALERLVTYLNSLTNPLEKALIAASMIAYIQPFEDGNKRTSRMLCNAILISNDLMPISFIGVDNLEYKKGILLFYEQNSIMYLKQLFIEQYELSVKKYF